MFRFISIGLFGMAASCAALAGTPAFVDAPVRPTGLADVVLIESTPAGDLVVLDNGYDSGLRPGMHCDVWRRGEVVETIIVVAARADRAVALIPASGRESSPQIGDTVLAKTLHLN